jgi:hypothetical protein
MIELQKLTKMSTNINKQQTCIKILQIIKQSHTKITFLAMVIAMAFYKTIQLITIYTQTTINTIRTAIHTIKIKTSMMHPL